MTSLKIVGQEKAKMMLGLITQAYKNRGTIPSIGIFGASGLGKTFLVEKFSEIINAELIYINGTSIADSMAFRSFFKDAGEDSSTHYLVFIDECHMLPRRVQENMLSILEDPAVLCTIAPKDMGVVDCVDGRRYIEKGDIMRESLPNNMSFILATTDPALLKPTILNRLRKVQLESYTNEEKAMIAKTYLEELGINIDTDASLKIAARSRSIRHLKNDICDTIADVYSVFTVGCINQALNLVDQMLGLDADGSTNLDIEYLRFVGENRIAGVDTISGYLKVDKKEVVSYIEPFLLEKGWVSISKRGRSLTKNGYKKIIELHPEVAPEDDDELFSS